jgi:hypothetical protein
LNPEVVTSTAKVKIAPTTNRKILTPRLKLLASSRMLRQLTVLRVLHASAIYRTLSIGPCARHCCYGSCINGKEEPARLDAVYTRTTYSDEHHQSGTVSTHRQAAAISSLHLEPLVVGLRPPGPRGLPTGPLPSGSPTMQPASAT